MKITVDFDKCECNALCAALAPDVFEVRDDGFLYVLDENPGDESRTAIEEAVTCCPVGAISCSTE